IALVGFGLDSIIEASFGGRQRKLAPVGTWLKSSSGYLSLEDTVYGPKPQAVIPATREVLCVHGRPRQYSERETFSLILLSGLPVRLRFRCHSRDHVCIT